MIGSIRAGQKDQPAVKGYSFSYQITRAASTRLVSISKANPASISPVPKTTVPAMMSGFKQLP